jgi:hypothetical protein
MAKHQNTIFNLTIIERKTNIRKLKLNEFMMNRTELSKLERLAIKRIIIKEANDFIQKIDSQKD